MANKPQPDTSAKPVPDTLAPVRRYLRNSAMAMLARREYSRREMKEKLLHRSRRRFEAQETDTSFDDADTSSADSVVSHASVVSPASVVSLLPGLIDATIDWLQAQDLQSDQRFAQSLIRQRSQRDGHQRLTYLLKWHEIDADLVAPLMVDLRRTELERAREVHARRFGQAPETQKEKVRQVRFLRSRGFCPDAIRQVLRDT